MLYLNKNSSFYISEGIFVQVMHSASDAFGEVMYFRGLEVMCSSDNQLIPVKKENSFLSICLSWIYNTHFSNLITIYFETEMLVIKLKKTIFLIKIFCIP